MRLWTINPRYLDTKGLTAVWREGLLAQKVLAGQTRGYKHHPQLIRFNAHPEPMRAIACFLRGIADEAQSRGYHFDTTKISRPQRAAQIKETTGQLLYEWEHLRTKLRRRAPQVYRALRDVKKPEPHPLFRIFPGPVRTWESLPPRKSLVVKSYDF